MVNGVLNIDKRAGITSHDVVNQVRKLVGERRVGHAGTLDPFATGVLLIAVGPATRLLEYAQGLPKTYEATIMLGATSDTDDKTGAIKKTKKYAPPTKEQVTQTLNTFIGQQNQLPPSYAAIKVQGRKLYEYARAGEEVPQKERQIEVMSLELVSYDFPLLHIRTKVGSGTYIRALARDIGNTLGCGGYVETLRRTEIGQFTTEKTRKNTNKKQSVKIDEISSDALTQHILPPSELVQHLPAITIKTSNVAKFKNGEAVERFTSETPATPEHQPLVVTSPEDELLGIGVREGSLLLPKKVL